jgi:hypothetical protein
MPHARTTDPVTSHEAAASVSNLTKTQQTILDLFKRVDRPMTDNDLVRWYWWAVTNLEAPNASDSGIRSRRAELTRTGKLRDSGARHQLPSGRNAIVWELAND